MTDGIQFGRLGPCCAHLCVDMQNLFLEPTEWQTPWMQQICPTIIELVESHPTDTIFTRFVPPYKAEDVVGAWRRYYQRWTCMTGDKLPSRLLDIIPDLKRFIPPATVIDKQGYSPFFSSDLKRILDERNIDSLVITGAETDVCVLASILPAIDWGYRVIVASDGVCSSADQGHDALIDLYHDRFSQQVEIASVSDIISAW
ncbi:isochorismatase family cysteine hydrolase (plasmid) [Kozakia baliensis]|uniref:cysteine hydrolase family protein n=1 Tax=Kozakia baliensis TaxID=153496 RepID=UPI00345B827F